MNKPQARAIIYKDKFTPVFVEIWDKQLKKVKHYDTLTVIDEIKKQNTNESDEKTEVDNMIIEEIKKLKADSYSKGSKGNLKDSNKYNSMSSLIEIPKIDFNFSTNFEDIYANTLNFTKGNNTNDTFSSKINCTKSEEKITICKKMK